MSGHQTPKLVPKTINANSAESEKSIKGAVQRAIDNMLPTLVE